MQPSRHRISKNSSVGETEGMADRTEDKEMAQSGKSWVSFLIIAFGVALTQTVAYYAKPVKSHENHIYALNILAAYTILLQWIVFIHAGGFFGNKRTEKYYDITGSFTFLTTLALSLYLVEWKVSSRQIILSVFVAVWSARLGLFLFTRIHNNSGIDSRFTTLKQSRSRFLMTWTLQGVWVFLTMLPVLILNQSTEHLDFGVYDYIGIPIWVLGFTFEVVADYQKSVFRKIAENKDKFISSGLWSISRHPNYFGEILLWLGVGLIAFGGLGAGPRAAFAFVSVVFVTILLIFISGIPLLEEKADKKYILNDDYAKYKKRTPVLVPFIGRVGDAKF